MAVLGRLRPEREDYAASRSGGLLAELLFELEELLDLEMTQIRAYSGQVSLQEVNILSKRIAAAVLLPRVVRQLTETRQDVAAHRSFMEKLDAAYRQGKITEKVRATLAAEYGLGLESATARLKAWEEEVEVWRINGRPVLEEGIAWLEEQEEIVKARASVGQLVSEEAQEKIDTLHRERARAEEQSRRLIAL